MTTVIATIFPKKGGYFTGAHYFILVVPILKVSITKGGSVYEINARRYEEEWKGETLSFLPLSVPSSLPESWIATTCYSFRDLPALFARGKLQKKSGDESNLTAQKERLKKMVFTSYNSLHSEYSHHKTSSTDQRTTFVYIIVHRGKYCCSVSSMCQLIVGDLMNRLIKLLSNCHVNGQPAELHFVILIPLTSAHHRWQPLTLWGSDKPIRELPHASVSKLDYKD